MKLPCTNKKSANPDGKYVWLRTQIGSMLKNQTYLGHVVSGKTEQINAKIKKSKMKSKEEYIIVENMHEAIIDKELWDKVQERLKSFHTDNRKKYEYVLKDLVFCEECGNKATFRHCKSKNKKGIVHWEGNSVVCRKRNDYASLCSNKPMGEHIIIEAIKDVVREELNNIEYTKKDYADIYNKAKKQTKNGLKTIEDNIKQKNLELNKIARKFEELYSKKISKSISVDEFKKQYSYIYEEKEKLNNEIIHLQKEKEDAKSKKTKESNDINKFQKLAEEFLKVETLDNCTLQKLVEWIKFDREKNITIKLKFSKPYNDENKVHRISGEKYIR